MIPAMSRNNPISLETLTCDHVARWINGAIASSRKANAPGKSEESDSDVPPRHSSMHPNGQTGDRPNRGIRPCASAPYYPAHPRLHAGAFSYLHRLGPLGHHRRQAFPATPSLHRKNEAVVVCQWISRCHCRGARSRSSCRLSIEVRLAPLSPLPYHRYEIPA
jgi:hypothetical protein